MIVECIHAAFTVEIDGLRFIVTMNPASDEVDAIITGEGFKWRAPVGGQRADPFAAESLAMEACQDLMANTVLSCELRAGQTFAIDPTEPFTYYVTAEGLRYRASTAEQGGGWLLSTLPKRVYNVQAPEPEGLIREEA